MLDQFSLKELYQVKLKPTSNMEINGRQICAGETLAYFDTLQMAVLNEDKSYITAHGGFNDRPQVFWETTKDIRLQFSKGIFSKVQFALMSNSKLLNAGQGEYVMVPFYEEVESDENNIITFTHQPVGLFYCYDKQTGERVNAVKIDNMHYQINNPYQDVILDYYYDYNNGYVVNLIGWRAFNGWYRLEAHTEFQDDITGQKKTGIIVIPQLKLMSDLSMRLGDNANPVVSQFNGIAIPYGERNTARVAEIYFLNDNVDSDM